MSVTSWYRASQRVRMLTAAASQRDGMPTAAASQRDCVSTAAAIMLVVFLTLSAHPPAAAAPPATPAPQPAAGSWRPDACPPPPAGSGPSTIKVTGPCALEHKGAVECNTESDDMQMIAVRRARKGAELMLYVNVERYVGAGRYKPPNDLYVSIKDGNKIYRWSANDFHVTVGPGSKYVELDNVLLEPELPLTGCTGPQWNYQCDGRLDVPEHMATRSTISGKLYCKAGGPKKATVPIP